MNNYLKYTFNINKYKNYKKSLIYKEFNIFKKLKYEGIHIIYEGSYSVKYKLDNQLMRKLKLLNINGSINKTEKLILYFVEKSVQISEEESQKNNNWWSSGNYITPLYDYYENTEVIEQKKEQKNNVKIQSKIFNQKIKQYENKGRFRK